MSLHALLRRSGPLLVGAVLFGCADHTAIGPDPARLGRGGNAPWAAAKAHDRVGDAQNGHDESDDHQDVAEQAHLITRATTLPHAIVATTVVTPGDGGLLRIDEAGLLVVFPPGSVPSNLTVSVTAQAGDAIVYTFEPHGTRFLRPVRIGQLVRVTTYTGMAGEVLPDLHGGYLSRGLDDVDVRGNGSFSEIFSVSYADQQALYAVFRTLHFSGYALASGRAAEPATPPLQ